MPTDPVDIPSLPEASSTPPDVAHDAGSADALRQPTRRRNDAERQRTNENKLSKRLLRETARAIHDFNMIEDGDKVMVCLSGGKDSYSLLDLLLTLKQRAPIRFDIIAVNLDQKQPGFPAHVLPDYLRKREVPFHIETRDTYSVVTRLIPEGKTMCSLCSRLRRGNLYRVASELGATKIALGHHRDDILGTFFLNLFYGGRMKAMSPKLMSDDGRHIIIRPMAYVAEKDLIAYSELKQFPIIPCNLCGSQENLKRKEVSRMIAEWDRKFPGRSWNVFGALSKVVGSHLMDRELFDFENLRATGAADENGDTAFDEESFPDLPSAADSHTSHGIGKEDAEDGGRFAPTVVARTVKPRTLGE